MRLSDGTATSSRRGALKIGLALSGGGVRAATFHLGMMERLAHEGRLEDITFISTVSGGSLCVGLLYALNGMRWPTSERYLTDALPAARRLLTERDLQCEAIRRALVAPHLLIRGRANAISACIERDWGITGLLKDLSTTPRWIINATTYESGKNWQFMPQRMGDHVLKYVRDPAIPVADAVAASAGFPVLIGPLLLDARAYEWWRYIPGSTREMERTERKVDRIRLWDGGVYDNLGVEPLFKPNGRGLRDDFNFLIVSDASGVLEFKPPTWGVPRILRPTNIAMDQVRSLRARILVDHFSRHPGSGVYLHIGRSARYLLEEAGMPPEQVAAAVPRCLDDEEVKLAAGFRTTLRRLAPAEFERLRRHGWEVADCTLTARCPDHFGAITREGEST